MIPNMVPRDASASKKVLVDWESTNLTQEDCADLAAYGNIPSGPTFLSAPGARGPGAPFWTYSQSKNRCWLKLSRSNLTSDRDVVSGNNKCGTKYQAGKTFLRLRYLRGNVVLR